MNVAPSKSAFAQISKTIELLGNEPFNIVAESLGDTILETGQPRGIAKNLLAQLIAITPLTTRAGKRSNAAQQKE